MMDARIILPADGWRCRPYQDRLWNYLNNGGKRAAVKFHRRSGKDATALHWTTVASQRRIGVYWHMLPTLRQCRKVIWENIDGDGKRVLNAWPGWETPGSLDGIVSHIRHDEMKIELHNGSIWYGVGSDNFDAVMGTNPVGVVFSEWALSDPRAWDYVRPILSENDGWAIFCWTPRGRNHASVMFDMATENPEWFAEKLTVEDTQAIPKARIDAERRAGMSESLVMQEYYCSEDAPLEGSFWGDQLVEVEKDKRICNVPHDPALKVDTWWDLGHSDATAIWFVQHAANEIHLIEYHESNGKDPGFYADVLERARRERRMVYGRHIFPHDGGAKTLASRGRPLSALFADLGVNVEVQQRHDPQVAIQRVRQILPRCWFDAKLCARGLDALRAFRKELDEDRSTEEREYFKPGYRHDWASHGSSAFYTGAMTEYDPHDSRRAPRDRYTGKPMETSHWAA